MNEDQAWKLTKRSNGGDAFFRYFMPYLFRRIEHPKYKWVFLPLNRNYKPLGYQSDQWVDYEEWVETHAVRFRNNPALLDGIWHNDPDDDETLLFLYDDSASSRLDYFKKLELLMSKGMTLFKKSFT